MTSLIPILIIIIAAAIGIPIYLKKKKGKTTPVPISARQNKDEVWKTIKQFLKDNNEYGREIVDSYVAKRNAIDYINPNDSKQQKDYKKFENKIRDVQYKEVKKQTGKKVQRVERDLYVVCFQTRNSKTLTLDEPRAIECEVVNTKINKKNWDRKILINGEMNYDVEMKWIAPLKSAEELKTSRIDKRREEQKAKKQKKQKEAKQKDKKK